MAMYGYVRVSTDRQADHGESLGAQHRTLEGYALMHGLTLDRVLVERGISGSKPLAERPEGACLLALLHPGDVVITPKLDRMFRSALDALDILARLKERGLTPYEFIYQAWTKEPERFRLNPSHHIPGPYT